MLSGPPPRRWAVPTVGAIMGLLSGMLGVAGGFVAVPLLMWFARLDQRTAAATSLVAIVPAAVVGTLGYLRTDNVSIVAGLTVATGGVVGSLIGTQLLRRLPLTWLRWLFIGVLLAMALQSAAQVPSRHSTFDGTVSSSIGLVAFGVIMGIASGLFGIGGGVVAVPSLIMFFGASDLLARGTSLLAMIPTALTGSAQNVRHGLIQWRDGLAMGGVAVGTSLVGVVIAHDLSPHIGGILLTVVIVAAMAQLIVAAVRPDRNTPQEGGLP